MNYSKLSSKSLIIGSNIASSDDLLSINGSCSFGFIRTSTGHMHGTNCKWKIKFKSISLKSFRSVLPERSLVRYSLRIANYTGLVVL